MSHWLGCSEDDDLIDIVEHLNRLPSQGRSTIQPRAISPFMNQRLCIATRKSPLATQQTNYIRDLLHNMNPDLNIETLGVTTTGDKTAAQPNARLSGKGDFLKEIESKLLDETADLAIHSMKDVPNQLPSGLTIQAVGPRRDPSDALIGVKSMIDLSTEARIGTSSCRRRALLHHLFNKTNVKDIRGNVDTRLQKLDAGEVEALVLASAGLVRLGLDKRIGCRLEPSVFVPAPGQGQLAAEFRSDDDRVANLVDALVRPVSSRASQCEREIVRELGADCTTPIGVYCSTVNGGFHVHCIVLDRGGEHAIRVSSQGTDHSNLSQVVARRLLSMGARELIETA